MTRWEKDAYDHILRPRDYSFSDPVIIAAAMPPFFASKAAKPSAAHRRFFSYFFAFMLVSFKIKS
jgi:hypothetical protein